MFFTKIPIIGIVRKFFSIVANGRSYVPCGTVLR